MTKSRRKQVVVNPSMQWRVVATLMGLWLGFLFGTIALLLAWHFVIGLAAGHVSFEISGELVKRYFPAIVVFGTTLPVLIWELLKLSHRLAGPMVPIRRTVQRLRQGLPADPIKLRKHDFWFELADDLNDLSEVLNAERQQRDEAVAVLPYAERGA